MGIRESGAYRAYRTEALARKAARGHLAGPVRYAAEQQYGPMPAGPMPRTPLTANQHILHLLLTVFTAGLWLPVWVVLSIRGNRRPRA